MEANELMVGDWVRNDLGEIQQIVELREAGAMLSYNDIYSFDNLEPIPITPEILEKNGFHYTNNHTLKGADTYVLRHEQNGFDYTITIKRNDWFTVDSFDDRMYRIFEMGTGRWCVHQLQHALRLCGIKKEIVL